MTDICNLAFSFQELLKLAPGLVIFPLSFYLAIKKIGISVSCSAQMGEDCFFPARVKNVVLSNNKDRPIAIYDVFGVFGEHIQFPVHQFEPPLILKALETISIATERYSFLTIGRDEWQPSMGPNEKIDFYVTTTEGAIKCKSFARPMMISQAILQGYVMATRFTKQINGKVISKKIRFIMVYAVGNDEKTALIESGGLLDEFTGLGFNSISQNHMQSVEKVSEYVRSVSPDLKFHVRESKGGWF